MGHKQMTVENLTTKFHVCKALKSKQCGFTMMKHVSRIDAGWFTVIQIEKSSK